jgi:PAS domain S-box-containing protein
MKVLYVEDNLQDADLTRRELRRSAPEIRFQIVDSLASGRERLDQFQSSVARGEPAPIDLVLMDLNLPDGNGLELLAEIRDRALPVAAVVLTGSGDEQTALLALRGGADDYLTKHEGYRDRLPATLRSALEHFRSQSIRDNSTLRLLYVETDESDIQLTRRHLADHAPYIRLEVCTTAEQALARLPASGPVDGVDVLLVDYRLGGMNGLEAIKEIKQVRLLDLPVILISGQGTEEIAAQALKLGAVDYLVKSPGHLHRLPSAVENAFARTKAMRERLALQEALEFNRQIITDSLEGIMVLDRELRYRVYNRFMERLTTWPSDTVLGKTVEEVLPQPLAGEVLSRMRRALAGEVVRSGDFLLPESMSKTPLWVSTKTSPLRNSAKDIIGVVVLLDDVTDRKQGEVKAREQINELMRWQNVMLRREERVLQLKAEVNELLEQLKQPTRYSNPDQS